MAAHPVPLAAQLASDPRCAVGAARVLVDLADHLGQLSVSDRPGRQRPGPPRVEPRPGHPGDAAQVVDAVLGLVLLNEPEAGHRFVSRAK